MWPFFFVVGTLIINMEEESFILVQDKQRKCLYLTLASTFKNSEGLEVIEKIPNASRAINALQKHSKQKVFGKMNLKDAIGDLANNTGQVDGSYALPMKKEGDDGYDDYDSEETYSSSAKGQKINRARAEKELRDHSHRPGSPEWQEFEQIFGPKFKKTGYIDAGELMNWLGY